MNNYNNFDEAMVDFRQSGGAMNFVAGHLPGESDLWQVGTVEEIEEASGTSWQDATSAAFEAGIRSHALSDGTPYAACSLCGGDTWIEECGAAWYLCADCEGTDEAAAAGYTHEEASHEIYDRD